MTIFKLEKRVKNLEGKLCCIAHYYDTFEDFPTEGRNGFLYVDKETGGIYIWNGEYITLYEEKICLNSYSPSFVPADINNPTTEEVQEWANANLQDVQLNNGTLVVYYVEGTCDEPDFVWILDSGEITLLPSGGGESVGLIEVTYAELVSFIGSGALIPKANYLLTDFATTHYFLDGNYYISDAINIADTEPIILTALSTTELESVAYSTVYTDDILHYDWNPTNWLNDRSFCDVDDVGQGNATIIEGFKGVIYYREDTKQKNITHYDFRGVKFRRWALNPEIWKDNQTCNKGDMRYWGSYVYKSLVGNNLNNEPSEGSDYWSQIVYIGETFNWSWNSSSCNGIPVNNSIFEDLPTFASNYEILFYNNYLGCKSTYYDDPQINTILPNIVFIGNGDIYTGVGYQVVGNRFEGGSYYGNSTIGNYFNSNTVGSYFNSNIVGDYFYSNIAGNGFSYNIVGNNFNRNTVGNGFNSNTVGNYFYYNTVGNYFYYNTVGNGFYSNTVGNGFNYNTVGNYFQSNTVGNNFHSNTVGNNFHSNTVGNYINNYSFIDSITYNKIGDNFTNWDYYQNLIDSNQTEFINSYIDLISGKAGRGRIITGNAVAYADFIFTTAGVVTLLTNSANVYTALQSGTNHIIIKDNGTNVRIVNELGGTYYFNVIVNYT